MQFANPSPLEPRRSRLAFKIYSLSLMSLGLAGLLTAAIQPLAPLDSVEGFQRREMFPKILELAQTSAKAGAGYEASRLLKSLTLSAPNTPFAAKAAELLETWGVEQWDLSEANLGRINQRVRERLLQEDHDLQELRGLEMALEFGDLDKGAETLIRFNKKPLIGEAKTEYAKWLEKNALTQPTHPTQSNSFTSSKPIDLNSLPQVKSHLETLHQLKDWVSAAKFLKTAEPADGRILEGLLKNLYPESEPLWEEVPMDMGFPFGPPPRGGPGGRGGFPGRFPPGVIAPGFQQMFGGRGPSPFGGDALQEPAQPETPPDLSISTLIETVNFLQKDDPALAQVILDLAKRFHHQDPRRNQLDAITVSSNPPVALQKFPVPTYFGTRFPSQPADAASPVFDGQIIPKYELTIAPEDIQKLIELPKEYVQGTLKYGDTILSPIGVRLKGSLGSFRNLDSGEKSGFTLKLNEFEKGKKLFGLKKIVLNNAVQDRSFLNEWLGYHLFRQAGLPAARVGHARLTVNGEDYGLYVQVESVTSDMLESWFGKGSGELYEGPSDISNWREIDLDSDPEKAQREILGDLDKAANRAIVTRSLEPLKDLLDIESFALFFAMEVLLDHWDGYLTTNNYRIYRNPKNGKFYLLPHGADQVFRNTYRAFLDENRGVLTQAMLASEEGRQVYLTALRYILKNVWKPQEFLPLMQGRYQAIRPHVQEDPRYPFGLEGFDASVKSTLQFFLPRARFAHWSYLALSDPDLARRMDSLNQDPRRFFNRMRGGGPPR